MPKFTHFWLPLWLLGASFGLARTPAMAEPILTTERQVNSRPAADIREARSKKQASEGFDSRPPEFETIGEFRADARRSAETVPTLVAALASQDDQVRRRAAMALGGKGPQAKAAAAALEKMLRDTNPADRREAAIALGRIGPEARIAESALEAVLRDEDSAVRAAASKALTSVRWSLGALCKPNDVPPSVVQGEKTICLNIAPREDAPEHPSEGWCAEVAIQEALLSLGDIFPKKWSTPRAARNTPTCMPTRFLRHSRICTSSTKHGPGTDRVRNFRDFSVGPDGGLPQGIRCWSALRFTRPSTTIGVWTTSALPWAPPIPPWS